MLSYYFQKVLDNIFAVVPFRTISYAFLCKNNCHSNQLCLFYTTMTISLLAVVLFCTISRVGFCYHDRYVLLKMSSQFQCFSWNIKWVYRFLLQTKYPTLSRNSTVSLSLLLPLATRGGLSERYGRTLSEPFLIFSRNISEHFRKNSRTFSTRFGSDFLVFLSA